MSTGYPFVNPTPTQDFLVQKPDPAIELAGTEPNGVWVDLREITGAWWLTTNATFNDSTGIGFEQVNPLLPSSALSLSTSGVLSVLTAAAGAPNPIVWTTQTITSVALPITPSEGGTGLTSVGPNGYVLTSNGTSLSFQPIPSSATSPYYNVMAFGATGLGYPNDDTVAIQAAINAAPSSLPTICPRCRPRSRPPSARWPSAWSPTRPRRSRCSRSPRPSTPAASWAAT